MKTTQTVFDRERGLPLIVEAQGGDRDAPPADIVAWLESERTWLFEKLHTHGVVVLRGFETLRDVKEFEDVAGVVSSEFIDYLGGTSPRRALSNKVAYSTEWPPELHLGLHQESVYMGNYPDYVCFFCKVEPQHGGITPVADMRRVLRRLPDELVARWEERQLRLTRELPLRSSYAGIKAWPEVMLTEDRAVAERVAAERGWKIEWLGDGMRLSQDVRPATTVHPLTQERVWFNTAHHMTPSWFVQSFLHEHQYLLLVRHLVRKAMGRSRIPIRWMRHADGGKISEADLKVVREATWAEKVRSPWRRGDVMIVDNLLASHGRAPFRGPRVILAALQRRMKAQAVAVPTSISA